MTFEQPRICGPAWFQDEHYSPEGHWIYCTDDRLHLEPVVDWIGDAPITHGERESEPKSLYDSPCLCGHPDYMTCPHGTTGQGSILRVEIKQVTV